MNPGRNPTDRTGPLDECQNNGHATLSPGLGSILDPHLNVLPNELLIQMIRTMPPLERIHAAFKCPELFINEARFNLFTDDAIRQLSYPTYEAVSAAQEEAPQPLLLYGIASPTVSVEQIGHMLDNYEAACITRGVDRRVFLDSAFPDNAPESIPPKKRNKRDTITPIHTAIAARRPRVVTYLLRRGADVYRTISVRGERLRPFQFVTSPVLWPASSALEDIAIELAPSSGVMAFTSEFHLTNEFQCAIFSGMDRLALLLVELFDSLEDIDHDAPALRDHKPLVLWHAVNSPSPLPRFLTALLQDATYCRPAEGPNPMIDFTIRRNNVMNSAIVLHWELEQRTSDREKSAESVAVLCRSDANLPMVRALAGEMHRFGYKVGLRRLLRFAMVAGASAIRTREWLVEHTDAADGEALAHAICFRDRATAERVRTRFRESGRPVDGPLFEGPADAPLKPYQEGWRETPLTLALMHRNYHEAAQLLQAGADAEKVPYDVRVQVGQDRFLYEAGQIPDAVSFVYFWSPQVDGTIPTWVEANYALQYSFGCLVDARTFPVSEIPKGNVPDSQMYWRLAIDALDAEINAAVDRIGAL